MTPRAPKAWSVNASIPGLWSTSTISDVLYRVVPVERSASAASGRVKRQEASLVGGVVFDPLGQRHQPMGIGSGPCCDCRPRRILFLGHDLGATRRIPGAHQLRVGQVLGQPYTALAQSYRM